MAYTNGFGKGPNGGDQALSLLPNKYMLLQMAKALRPHHDANKTLSLMDDVLKAQYINRPGPDRATSTTTFYQAGVLKQYGSPTLTRIPNEVFLMITDELSPADNVCLAQVNTEFREKMDFSLPDLDRFCFAWTRDKREPGQRMRENVFEVTARLDRDRVGELENQVRTAGYPGDMLVCSVCVEIHSVSYFADNELTTPAAQGRKCLHATNSIWICDRWTLDFVALRAWRRDLLTGGGRRTGVVSRTKDCPSHAALAGYCSLSTNCRDELVNAQKTELMTNVRGEELAMLTDTATDAPWPEVRVCTHVNLTAGTMLDAYSAMFQQGHSQIRSCRHCETSWEFVASPELTQPTVFQCSVIVSRVLGDLKDPTDDRLWTGVDVVEQNGERMDVVDDEQYGGRMDFVEQPGDSMGGLEDAEWEEEYVKEEVDEYVMEAYTESLR